MTAASAGIRLVVLDDGLFVRAVNGTIHPQAATFHRFVEAVVAAGPFARARYVVPVRDLEPGAAMPTLPPIEPSLLEVVPSAPFAGIADYVTRAPYLAARNWPTIRRALAGADLLWLRLPASNALLAVAAARRANVPRFCWLAGSVAQVVAGQRRPLPLRIAARLVGAGYDAGTRLAARGVPSITLDAEQFASVVTAAEVQATRRSMPAAAGQRIVWAGRMAAEKGLEDLLDALERLAAGGREVELLLVGDGPLRADLERSLPRTIAGRVSWAGHVGERQAYMDLLRSGALFVLPSRAEGAPKVLVEAMAAGTPVVATRVGAVPALLADGELGELVPAGDPGRLAQAIGRLLDEAPRRHELSRRGLAWADRHTVEAQAAKLVDWLRGQFPHLAWAAAKEHD